MFIYLLILICYSNPIPKVRSTVLQVWGDEFKVLCFVSHEIELIGVQFHETQGTIG